MTVYLGNVLVVHWLQFVLGIMSLLLIRTATLSTQQIQKKEMDDWCNELNRKWGKKDQLDTAKKTSSISSYQQDFVHSVLGSSSSATFLRDGKSSLFTKSKE